MGNSESQYRQVKEVETKLIKHNFTILHINIRSIHANINGLQELLASNLSPDIIALSETKLKVSKNAKFP